MTNEEKLRKDICRVVGHEVAPNAWSCNRCGGYDISEALGDHLKGFIGTKTTPDMLEQVRLSTEAMLRGLKAKGDVKEFSDVHAVIDPLTGRVDVTMAIQPDGYFSFITIKTGC